MEFRDFAYWLQGFFEIQDADELTPEQVEMIKSHLNLCFKHEATSPSIARETLKGPTYGRFFGTCGTGGRVAISGNGKSGDN